LHEFRQDAGILNIIPVFW